MEHGRENLFYLGFSRLKSGNTDDNNGAVAAPVLASAAELFSVHCIGDIGDGRTVVRNAGDHGNTSFTADLGS